MNKLIGVVVGLLVVAVIGWAAVFWWQNLRGAGPAFRPPAGDIAGQNGTSTSGEPNSTGLPLTLPPGFRISVFARQLEGPRVLVTDPSGVLLTSIPGQGRVVALPDRNSDGTADETIVVADGLNSPHGLAFRCEGGACRLYVAEADQVATFDYDAGTKRATNKKKIIDLPGSGVHRTRTLLFYEDRLLISVGSSCNVCHENDWRRAKILVANPDGSDLKEYAKGLRNAVFMVEQPETKKVWATEMGRDLLGDNVPPDEINIVEEGKNYGWPICYGKNIHDTQFDKNTYIRNPCMLPFETPSHVDLQAHSAPLGLAFIPDSWPEDYRGDLLVAFHGSWNRTEPTGYKVVRLKLDEGGKFQAQEDFITGWLSDDTTLGRPADVLFQDKDLYLSDDKAGVIYRITSP